MRLRAWVGTVAIVAVACDGSGGPTGPDGSIEGTYMGAHRFTLDIEGAPIIVACGGTVVIFDIAGGTLAGTLTVNVCPEIGLDQTGTTGISGSIADGHITFTLPAQDELVGAVLEGCTITRIDDNFAGTIEGGQLEAVLTATGVCEDNGPFEFDWLIQMEKA